MKITLPKIRKYHVYVPNGNCISTDDPNLAERKAILSGGQVFENVRYDGLKRLQKRYFQAVYTGKDASEFHYPDLIKVQP